MQRQLIIYLKCAWRTPIVAHFTGAAAMTALLAASLSLLMIFTALLSGVFGMAGGLILVGVLLVVMPLPQAMVLHAVTQMASNGWRALVCPPPIAWETAAASAVRSPSSVGLWVIRL